MPLFSYFDKARVTPYTIKQPQDYTQVGLYRGFVKDLDDFSLQYQKRNRSLRNYKRTLTRIIQFYARHIHDKDFIKEVMAYVKYNKKMPAIILSLLRYHFNGIEPGELISTPKPSYLQMAAVLIGGISIGAVLGSVSAILGMSQAGRKSGERAEPEPTNDTKLDSPFSLGRIGLPTAKLKSGFSTYGYRSPMERPSGLFIPEPTLAASIDTSPTVPVTIYGAGIDESLASRYFNLNWNNYSYDPSLNAHLQEEIAEHENTFATLLNQFAPSVEIISHQVNLTKTNFTQLQMSVFHFVAGDSSVYARGYTTEAGLTLSDLAEGDAVQARRFKLALKKAVNSKKLVVNACPNTRGRCNDHLFASPGVWRITGYDDDTPVKSQLPTTAVKVDAFAGNSFEPLARVTAALAKAKEIRPEADSFHMIDALIRSQKKKDRKKYHPLHGYGQFNEENFLRKVQELEYRPVRVCGQFTWSAERGVVHITEVTFHSKYLGLNCDLVAIGASVQGTWQDPSKVTMMLKLAGRQTTTIDIPLPSSPDPSTLDMHEQDVSLGSNYGFFIRKSSNISLHVSDEKSATTLKSFAFQFWGRPSVSSSKHQYSTESLRQAPSRPLP